MPVRLGLVDLASGLDEQLFLKTDLSAPDYLRQHAAHDRFNWAAVIGADPFRELEQLLAQHRRLTHYRFDRPDPFRVALIERGDDGRQTCFATDWNAHPRADAHSLSQIFRHGIIQLAMNRAVDNHPDVTGFQCHCGNVVDPATAA